jgi:uncharacterized protein YndB with AHSA1/START domain
MQTATSGIPSDRIQKTITLRAPRGRVWRAISNPKDFGAWFGASLDGPFEPGARVAGTITPTTVHPANAAEQRAFSGVPVELLIDRVEPDHLVAFRWQPYAVSSKDDAALTQVSFELNDDHDGVVLTITESGFEALPEDKRSEAYADNERGWEKQLELIRKYVTAT